MFRFFLNDQYSNHWIGRGGSVASKISRGLQDHRISWLLFMGIWKMYIKKYQLRD